MITCTCKNVSQKEVKQFMQKHPHATYKELKTTTTASTGCGRCSNNLIKAFEMIKSNQINDGQFRIKF